MDRINLFWTGGFDSTYRMLEILLVERKSVQPYYVISTYRESTMYEIRSMEAIRDLLFERDPETKELLQPIRFGLKKDIRPSPRLTGQYNQLLTKIDLGMQYEWLARFAEEHQLYDVEMSFEAPTVGPGTDLYKLLLAEWVGEGHNTRIRENPSDDDLNLFRYFRFPLAYLTKLDMREFSRQHGFEDILDRTWYCHSPTPDGLPCGYCHPCQFRKESGLSYYVPKRPLVRRVLGRMKRRLATVSSNQG